MATILAVIFFIPFSIIAVIAFAVGAVTGGEDGIETAGNILLLIIELGIVAGLLWCCFG